MRTNRHARIRASVAGAISHARIRASLAGALLAVLSACAGLGGLDLVKAPRFQRVDDPGSSLRLLAPSASRPAGGAALRIWTRVENPNPVGLRVTEVVGRLYVQDVPVDVDFPLGLPLVAQADSVIPLDVTVGFEDVPRLAGIVGQAVLAGEPVDYRIEGTIAVDAGSLGTPRFGPMRILGGTLQPIR